MHDQKIWIHDQKIIELNNEIITKTHPSCKHKHRTKHMMVLYHNLLEHILNLNNFKNITI